MNPKNSGVSKSKLTAITLTSGKDILPWKIMYKNKDGEKKNYYMVETKRGRLRLESSYKK